MLKEYGNDLSWARRHYRAYVRACLLEDDAPLLEAMAASRYAIGGSAFIERTEERIGERRTGRVQDRDLDLPRWAVSLDEIDAVVRVITAWIRACCRPMAAGWALRKALRWSWRRNWPT